VLSEAPTSSDEVNIHLLLDERLNIIGRRGSWVGGNEAPREIAALRTNLGSLQPG
jgi:hypothetical protein